MSNPACHTLLPDQCPSSHVVVMHHFMCSELSEIFTFHTGVAVPGKPPPPAVTAVGVTYLEVQWEETKSCGDHVTAYKLEMEDCSSVRQRCQVCSHAMQ